MSDREAQFLVEEGAAIEAVDNALYEYGMAMGPLATGDLAGLDVGWRIRKEYQHLQKPGVRQAFIEERLCELGRFGQKTGAGWYKYDENRKAVPDSLVTALIRQWIAEAGIPPRQISSEEIVERCIWTLVNEGARILDEGIALRAADVDIIYINGYGFPAHRGGPMWYADTVGLKKVCGRIREFQQRLAEQGKTFAEFSSSQSAAA
jgi:3-hydroxyacyl-CoA dehydrogenase